jgi:protein O-mannosyl-transferase
MAQKSNPPSAALLKSQPERLSWQRVGLVVLGLVALLVTYSPALNGGFVWDDDFWTIRLQPLFESPDALFHIWSADPMLQQYYPLTATTFWAEWHLWGTWTLPYHMANVLLHGVAAALLGSVLSRLDVRGAWLAALLFAFHPINVESVAWITERKNVLSLALSLAAVYAYGRACAWWRDPASLHCGWYISACFLVALALLAKITAFVVAPMLLAITWWHSGSLSRHLKLLVPMFFLTLVLGSVVWWMELYHVGAETDELALPWTMRVVSAGRVTWFYLWKILWPVNLSFIYPDWRTDPITLLDYLWPTSVVLVLLAAVWLKSRISHGIWAAVVLYFLALAPVAGFLQVYGSLYSPVWDHWAYVPALAVLVPVGSWLSRFRVLAILLLGALATLSFHQAGFYVSRQHLWQETIRSNPKAWIALNNLGASCLRRVSLTRVSR